MKLLRYGPLGQEKAGSARPRRQDPRPLRRGPRHRRRDAVAGLARPAAPARSGDTAAGLGLAAARPLRRRVSKIVAIGLNYRLHAAGGRHADPEGADFLHEGDVRRSAARTTT